MATGTEANRFFEQAGQVIASAMGHALKDGTLAAAGRMGIDELGTALKAFPDAIQEHESGSIWNPTQGEIAQARADRLPSPSEIAAETRAYQPPADHGHDHQPKLGQSR